ncbi:MAG: hypothetical protein RIC80_14935 [Cyclobacteriaceae bacterium]
MSWNIEKISRRLASSVSYGATQLAPRFFTLVISWILIRRYYSELWGEYVEVFLIVNLAAMVLSFGNFQYLLKEFSTHPGNIYQVWSRCLTTRLLLIVPMSLLAKAFYFSDLPVSYLIVWLIVVFVNQSFQVLIVFNKVFKKALYVELLSGTVLVIAVLSHSGPLSLELFIQIVILSLLAKMLLYVVTFWHAVLSFQVKVDLRVFKEALPFALLSFMGTVRAQSDIYMVALFLDSSSVGQYHVLITVVTVVESGAAYIFNPSARLLYRTRDATLQSLKRAALVVGIPFAFLSCLGSYMVLSTFYSLQFPTWFYLAILVFSFPQLFKMIVVNEFYKLNGQNALALLAFIFVCFQGILGYSLIPSSGIQAAIALRVGGFLVHLLTLQFFLRYYR